MTADATLHTRIVAALDADLTEEQATGLERALRAVVELAEDMQRPGAPLFFPTFGLKVQMTIADQLGLTEGASDAR